VRILLAVACALPRATACSSSGGFLRWAGEPLTTLIGCDEALSAQDHWLSDLLTKGAKVRLDGSTLTLTRDTTVIHLDRET
jgi:hypothetical protein